MSWFRHDASHCFVAAANRDDKEADWTCSKQGKGQGSKTSLYAAENVATQNVRIVVFLIVCKTIIVKEAFS